MFASEAAVSVSEINRYIKTLFETSDILNGISVRGEISNFKRHSSGHLYFSLKDEGGLIRAVMFRSAAAGLSFAPRDGMKVVAHGDVGVYVKDGQYQLYVTSMVPDGLGDLYLAFEALKRKLQAEGLFDTERKKPIPLFPTKIGIITSETGAAIQDMVNIITRRYPPAQIFLRPAEVQGTNAPPALISALRFFEDFFPVDVIIIGRGGGSIEDLWAFNDERLARTVAACRTPVISAVGHESDFTICDFVADLRAPTPSAAAELATPDREELTQRLEEWADKLSGALRSKLFGCQNDLLALEKRACFRRPALLWQEKALTLSALSDKLEAHARHSLELQTGRLNALEAALRTLDPAGVLRRGYAILRDEQGKTVTSVCDLAMGSPLQVLVRDGTIDATVTHLSHEERSMK